MYTIELDLKLLQQKIDETDWEYITNILRKIFLVKLDEENNVIQYCFNSKILDFLLNLLKLQLKCEQLHEDFFFETIKALRNCTTNPECREYLTCKDIVQLAHAVFSKYYPKSPYSKCLKIIMQLFINLTINNSAAAHKINDTFHELPSCLENKISLHETSALLYNISIYCKLNVTENLIYKTFEFYHVDYNTYLKFLIEKFCSYDLMWDIYNDLKLESKIVLLECIVEHQVKNKEIIFNMHCLDVLVSLFINSSQIVFQSTNESEQHKPYEISLILQILAHVSGDQQEFLLVLQKNVDLLIQAGILLINIHRLSKESDNCFTQESKISDLDKMSNNDGVNPVHGFKGDLVRLVGNLSWKCKRMQDLAREAELIPIILECCSIDMKNPFIMQWSIFALSNLCDNNSENQKIIAGMKKKADVPVSVLKEAGLTLHSEQDKEIGIVQLDVLKDKLNK